jgi:hypothetical protein
MLLRRGLCCAVEGPSGADPHARVIESIPSLFYRLLDLLNAVAADHVLIIIDEADYLVGSVAPDLLRDLFDECGGRALFAFISISSFAARMANPSTPLLEAAASRLAIHRKLNGASQTDAQTLADHLVEGVKIEPDLIAHILKSTHGSVRSLLDRYEDVETLARLAGVDRVSLGRFNELQRLAGGAVDEAPAQKSGITQSITHSAAQSGG